MYYFTGLQIMRPPLSHIRTDRLKNLYQPWGVDVSVLRLDELDPQISGNKWFKLAPYLQRALDEKKRGLLTFGGAWSNHILATAAACRKLGIASAAIIRGERPATPSFTLRDAEALGMQLYFSSRAAYAAKEIPEALRPGLEEWLLVPEGGYAAEGMQGASLITETIDWDQYTHIVAAVGTGTTLAGLIAAGGTASIIGINVLKNEGAPESAIRALLPQELHGKVDIRHGFHEGGYARQTPGLLAFMNEWYQKTGIPSDFVYTGKLFRAADALVRSGAFPAGSRVLIVHSGGLQGNRSLPPATLIF
jgi:1-aminocyclopropane-1-carboxylate deaminase